MSVNLSLTVFLIFPVIGGYFFSKDWAISEYEVAREDGHKLYFRAAFYGFNLFIFSYATYFLFSQCAFLYTFFRNGGRICWLKFDPGLIWPTAKSYEIFAILTIWLGPILAGLINTYGDRLERYRLFASRRFLALLLKRPFEELLWRSNEKHLPISFTMDTNLVFIGYWKASSSPIDSRNTIKILPVASGYRDQKGSLIIRTVYEEIYSELDQNLKHLETEDLDRKSVV